MNVRAGSRGQQVIYSRIFTVLLRTLLAAVIQHAPPAVQRSACATMQLVCARRAGLH